jgi:hypothetical protein
MSATCIDGVAEEIDFVAKQAAERNRFLRASWFKAAATAFEEAGGCKTVLGWRRDVPVIAICLGRPRPPIMGVRSVPGSYWPFRSFPVASDVSAEEMADFLSMPSTRRGLGWIWRVGPIYENDASLSLLREAAPSSGWSILPRHIATSYVLDIGSLRAQGPWPRNSTLSKNRFHEKHLAKHGALQWDFASADRWTETTMSDLADVEQRSWVATETDSSDAKFMSERNRRFWECLRADPTQARSMWAALLRINGAPAAFSFDLNLGGTKYAIANSYDPTYAKHSPGKCLYYRNLVEGVKAGLLTVDWGAGDSGYKTTIGAEPGPRIIDCLVVRNSLMPGPLSAMLERYWKRSGRP